MTMKLIIDVDEKIVCKGFEQPLTEEERMTLIRAIGNGRSYNPSGDLISREALKENFEKAEEQADTYEMLVEFHKQIIDNAQAIPERPQGEWINHRNDYGHNIADCSLCGKAMQWHDEDEDGIPRYCWYCGAKMKGGAE